jgi:hypothetical protein
MATTIPSAFMELEKQSKVTKIKDIVSLNAMDLTLNIEQQLGICVSICMLFTLIPMLVKF